MPIFMTSSDYCTPALSSGVVQWTLKLTPMPFTLSFPHCNKQGPRFLQPNHVFTRLCFPPNTSSAHSGAEVTALFASGSYSCCFSQKALPFDLEREVACERELMDAQRSSFWNSGRLMRPSPSTSPSASSPSMDPFTWPTCSRRGRGRWQEMK